MPNPKEVTYHLAPNLSTPNLYQLNHPLGIRVWPLFQRLLSPPTPTCNLYHTPLLWINVSFKLQLHPRNCFNSLNYSKRREKKFHFGCQPPVRSRTPRCPSLTCSKLRCTKMTPPKRLNYTCIQWAPHQNPTWTIGPLSHLNITSQFKLFLQRWGKSTPKSLTFWTTLNSSSSSAMLGELLQIVSWNVTGLCDPNKKLLVCLLLSSLHQPIHILMLQELKANTFRLKSMLFHILLGYHQIISQPNEDKGGSTLLIHPNFNITNCGSIQYGTLAWASISPRNYGYFQCGFHLHPNLHVEQPKLWHALHDTLPNGNWKFGGDFNFTELISNSTTQALILNGVELNKWQSLKACCGLKGAYHILNKVNGSIFMWNWVINNILV